MTANPQAPHVVSKYDTANRLIASGTYSSASGLSASSDPTSGATNRLGIVASDARLQVLVNGLTNSRFEITCNGRALPLQPTGRNGEFVAGVRYRAWQPPSALHPTIPVHAPLTFDVVDTWMHRSVAGCRYHVMHPGGRNDPRVPVNSYEAESRRLARFSILDRTPGRVEVAPPALSREFPYTLDLRTLPESRP